MSWWKAWKAKHWDEIEHPEWSGPGHFGPAWKEAPALRAWVKRLANECQESPMKAVGLALGVIAALGGVIAGIIRLLH